FGEHSPELQTDNEQDGDRQARQKCYQQPKQDPQIERRGDQRHHQEQEQETQHHRPAAGAAHEHQGVVNPHREDDHFQRGPPNIQQDIQDCHPLRARIASAILSACSVWATSWVRIMRAPARTARQAQANAAGSRSATSAPSSFPINDFRETPRSTGRLRFVNRSSPPSNCKLCSRVLPKPIPGSNTTWTASTPARFKRARRSTKKSPTSRTTSR